MVRPEEKHHYTYDDLLELPDDRNRYEIIDGDLIVSRTPTSQHQDILGDLVLVLSAHVRARGLGRVFFALRDVLFADGDVIVPDIFFLAPEHADRVKEKWVEGPLDLAIEITTFWTDETDRTTKRAAYAKHGVPFYWLVDGEARALEELRLEGAEYVLNARVEKGAVFHPATFPGLEIPLASIWASWDSLPIAKNSDCR